MSGEGRALVAGEALFDLWLADGEVHGRPGGGPFNTARTLGRLRRPVAYLGALSQDGFGRTLRRHLAQDGVAPDAIVDTTLPSTLALADIGAAGGVRYGFWGEGTASAGLSPEAALAAIPDGVDILHVGTLGLTFEPIAAALEAVVERVADSALVAVDPNCRPAAIEDEAAYRGRLARILRRAHLMKVSEEDLAWHTPARPPLEAARAMLDAGPAVVLLTRGHHGATVVSSSGDTAVPAPAVEVVDTIGAGDAFGGGFLAWWRARGHGRDALADHDLVVEGTRFACLVAARTCERPGASPPRLAEL